MWKVVKPKLILQDYECPICHTGIITKAKEGGKVVRVAPDYCRCCFARFDWKDVWWAKKEDC